MIKVNFNYVQSNNLVDFKKYEKEVKFVDEMIKNKTGLGNDFLGRVDYPENYDREEINRICKKAEYFKNNFEVLIVCGIGGSFLGANAAIDAINGLFPKSKLIIIFLGNTLDTEYVNDAIEFVKGKKFCICCISKSGTTTETSVSFRILKNLLEAQIGKEKAKDAIVCVTDKEKGALKTLANKEGYETYILPDDIGGRFSVMSPVGLFPMACAGIDIIEFLSGLNKARVQYSNPNILENDAYRYALERHYLYKEKGYKSEMLCTYSLNLRMFNEWWKQLYGESEGKENSGLLPTSAIFTTDLHSLGQFIQEGSKILFETVLYIDENNATVKIPYDDENLDGLNFIADKDLNFVNKKAYEGTLLAHSQNGDVPVITLNVDKLNASTLGELFYFFMKACAMSAYLNKVNPFNQPGVEIYKKNMFHLLGKPGY